MSSVEDDGASMTDCRPASEKASHEQMSLAMAIMIDAPMTKAAEVNADKMEGRFICFAMLDFMDNRCI